MDSDWPIVKLSELVNEITVGFVGSMTHEYVDDGIPFFRSKNISEYEIEWNDIRYISPEFHYKIKKSVLRPGDVAIVRTGKPGTACVIPDFVDEANCSDVVIVRVNNDKLSAHYLCYFMNSIASHQVSSHLVGAVQQHFNVASAKRIEIPLPTRDEQEEIVKILKALDDKRIINRQINQTLEAIAQAIFKSWFVDFEPVKAKIAAIEAGEDTEGVNHAAMSAISGKTDEELNQLQVEQPEHYKQLKTTAELFPSAMQDSELGQVPESWNIKTIQELAKIIKGKSYKSAELAESKTALVTLKSFNRGGGYRLDGLKEYTGSYKAEQEVFAGDLIIAYTDVTQAADVIGKPAMVVSDSRYEHLVISLDVAIVRPEIDCHKYFLYGLAMMDTFQNHTKSYTTGTTVLHLGKSAVPEFKFSKPREELMELYGQNVSSMFTLINEKIEESKNMERLRDTLLPKLLSGELSINAIEVVEGDV